MTKELYAIVEQYDDCDQVESYILDNKSYKTFEDAKQALDKRYQEYLDKEGVTEDDDDIICELNDDNFLFNAEFSYCVICTIDKIFVEE